VVRPGSLPRQLFELALRRATGMLVVQDGEIVKKSYLVEGVPEVTTSTDPTELFGALLVSKGLAVPMEIEMALAVAPRYGGRLGDALVGLEVLRPMDLARAIVDHMRRRFVQLAGWKKGQMRFIDGTRNPGQDDTMPEALHPLELITRGVLESYTEAELADIIVPIASAVIFPVQRAPISMASLGLPLAETVVLRAAEGRHTVEELVAEALTRGGCDRVSAMRGVLIGLSSGILVCPAWPPSEGRESLPTLPDL